MIKKLHLFIMLGLLSSAMSALAETYTQQAVNVVFAMSDKTNPDAYTVSHKNVFSEIKFDLGTGTITGIKDITNPSGQKECDGLSIQPKTSATDKISWFISPSEGLTFTPTKVSGYVNRDATDVENGITITVKKTNGDEIELGTYTAWRSTKTSSKKDYDNTAICKYEISLTEEQQNALKGTDGFYLYSTIGVKNDKKGVFGKVTIEGIVDGTTTSVAQYTKPTITQGEYNRTSVTYPVTLATQNGEDGTINYTIADGQKVSGVASGTIVDVPINTTIKATVSGSAYAESNEASLTTSDMPALAIPTHSVQDYSFESHLYTIALSAEEGATIMYSINGLDEAPYSRPLNVSPNTEIKAYAKMVNMRNSENLSLTVPGTPKDGSHSTPTSASYTDGKTYDGVAFTIPNDPDYIAGQISSNKSSINGAIKMRISRKAAEDLADKYGFHIDVNKGYTITSVKLQMLNNYDTDIALTGIYADDDVANNLLSEAVTLPYASANTVKAATAEVDDIAATNRIVFTFDKQSGADNPNQAQILISVTCSVPEYAEVNSTVGYGTMYYEKELTLPADTKAYTAKLNGSSLVLSELTSGIIPAKTAVIVNGNGGLFKLSHTGATFSGQNDLKGTATAIETSSVSGGTVCTLGYENSTAAFYKYVGETLAANKAYIVVPESISAGAKGISIVVDNNVTGIAEIKTNTDTNAPIYNIAGQRVTNLTKGLVIVNGKKIIK